MRIPNWTYLRTWQQRKSEIMTAVEEVLSSGRVILGPKVEEFERSWARYVGTNHCVGVNSGTDAIELALRAGEVGPGTKVVTVPNTAVPTVAAIRSVGAMPVFVDINPETYLMDVGRLERACSEDGVRAIIPVHLYGQAVEMDEVMRVARKFGLWVVEDCAQAHGCTYKGKRVGSIGDVGAWSFYPTKVLGALGDAGACTTFYDRTAEKIRLYRKYGMSDDRYYSIVEGRNSRLDEVQAAILLVQLRYLERDISDRIVTAKTYDLELMGCPVIRPSFDDGHVFYLYVIRSRDRGKIVRHLQEVGIEARVHFPTPIHQMQAYQNLVRGAYPNAELASGEILSLPLFVGITDKDIREVCKRVREAVYVEPV